MPEWLQWVAGLLSTVTLGVLGWVANVLVRLPREYVPRDEFDKRFGELKSDVHDDITKSEDRAEKRFDRLEAILVRIEDKVDGKQDK